MVDTGTAIEIAGDVGISVSFIFLYVLSTRVARAFSQGSLVQLFKTVSLVLLLFAIRELVVTTILVFPSLEPTEVFLDVGFEILILIILVVGVVRVRDVVRSLQPGKMNPMRTAPVASVTPDEQVLADILQASLSALATIMGPSVIYGVAFRASHSILDRTGRTSDPAWMERFLPAELRPPTADPMQTPPKDEG